VSYEPGRTYRIVTALVERDGRYLITQRCAPDALVGLWEFPSEVVRMQESDEVAIRRALRERLGVEATVAEMKACRTQKLDGRSIEVALYEVAVPAEPAPRLKTVADLRWVAPTELEQYPFVTAEQGASDLLSATGQEHPRRRADAKLENRKDPPSEGES
jgi:8-oxo-dGTP diphosphatase